jgi:hypothetical protein
MCGFADCAAWLAASQRVRAVLVDFCGYGESTCPTGEVTSWQLTASVVDWARRTGAKWVVLVGASAGGGDAVAVGDARCPVATMRALTDATPAKRSVLAVVDSTPGEHGWDLLPGTTGGDRWSPLAVQVAGWVTGRPQ